MQHQSNNSPFHLDAVLRGYWLRVSEAIFAVFVVCIFHIPITSLAQTDQALPIESELKNLYGLEKLKALNYFVELDLERPVRKTVKYAKQAVALGENFMATTNSITDSIVNHHLLLAYFQYGKVLFIKEDYFDAREFLYKARSTSSRLDIDQYDEEIASYLEEIRLLNSSGKIKEGIFSKTIGNLKIGKAVNDVSSDLRIQTEIKQGKNQEEKKDFRAAIVHYKKSINLLSNQGDSRRITALNLKIASLLDSLDRPKEVQQHLAEAIETIESLPISRDSNRIEILREKPSNLKTTRKSTNQTTLKERNNLKSLAEEFERKNDFKSSLKYFKLYESLSAKNVADSLRFLNREHEITLLKQQKLIADKDVEVAQLEKERHRRHRNLILLASILLLGSVLVTLYYYITKRSQHRKLSLAYTDLDLAKDKLQDAESRIRTLLTQQVSGDIAAELITNDAQNIGRRHFVCIMFLDIRDFTPMAEKLSPEDLIVFQNEVFGFMMDIIQAHHGNINQLLGDGFMATFGAPVSHGNDCNNAFLAAKEIVAKVEQRNEVAKQETHIRIGLHAGDVVTGNVGNEKRKQYSVTGNPVIIASRVEQLNKKYNSRLIVTEEVAVKLPHKSIQFDKRNFEPVKIKGRKELVNILVID